MRKQPRSTLTTSSAASEVNKRQILHRAGTGGTARGHTNPETKNQERRAPKRADKPTSEKPKAQANENLHSSGKGGNSWAKPSLLA